MFQKPTFGANTSFGATTSSPFGGFKSTPGTSAFGAAPAFGTGAATQPAAGTGLFGATNTTGGLFGNTSTSTATTGFGSNTSTGFGFGQPSTSGGLFGATNTTGGLFGANQQATTNSFGAKPAGFGFGSTPAAGTTSTGLFGTPAQNTSGLFAPQNTSIGGGGGLFGTTTSTFGQQQGNGTALVKYNPVPGTDVMMKSGSSQNINIKHHCITCMKEYENKSLEELRLEDYMAGRKGAAAGTGGMFGGFQPQADNKSLFGGTTFGQPAATSASNMFPAANNAFGQSNAFSFGSAAQAPGATNLFGAPKPAFGAAPAQGTGLFGTATTQSAPAFGASTNNAFGFGANTQNQSTNLFGAKPATSAFGTTPATGATGFGAFGANSNTNTLFGAKPITTQANTFGTPATGGFGLGGFGTNTSTSGGLFGANNAFAAKPAQPTFGFGTNTNTTGFGTTGGLNTFQKPAGSLFPTTFSTANTSLFNTTQNTQPLNFGTGTTGLGTGGLNFGTTTLGGSSLGGLGGFGTTANTLNTSNLAGSAASGNVHDQILALAARPYGDSPLFKDLLPDSTTKTDNMLKPTNPAAVQAVLDSSGYRVGSPETRIKVQPRPTDQNDKKSLFDGLEESDASLEGKLTLKPSRKRLVLRPNKPNHVEERTMDNNRSFEEQVRSPQSFEPISSTSVADSANKPNVNSAERVHQRSFEENQRGVNTDLESSSEKHSSWLGSSRLESTPRLYPDLDKEAPVVISPSERRASWLTTKPLRKPLSNNRDSIENSVRELRADIPLNDKENDDISVSEEENIAPIDATPHPTGVKLTRPGYYTAPTLDEMLRYKSLDGSIWVPHLTVGRKNYGSVTFDGEVNVAGLNLDELVQFLNKEIIVYPDDSVKPPVGQGLNRRATVTLDRVWPRDKTERTNITDPERLLKMDYEGKLRRVCDKHDTKFVEYRPETGSWVFRVKHFSKYGLSDSDEEEEQVINAQRQLANQALQKAAPIMAPKVPSQVTTPGPGLGGLTSLISQDSIMAMQHQTSLNLLNGNSKAYDMDVTDDSHITEQATLYPDMSRVFGVKSPTGELARLEHRSSQQVQLMKASLYADTEMDDDVSISTGDQRVPSPKSSIPEQILATPSLMGEIVEDMPQIVQDEEVQMRPIILRPHTNILRFHRKVPPLKHTVAGHLDAACIADLAISRARYSRVGFGPRRELAYVTTHNAITDLSPTAELAGLEKYIRGRHTGDWSEHVVARVSLARFDKISKMHDVLTKLLDALLDHSSCIGGDEENAPLLTVTDDPKCRLKLLKMYLKGSKQCAIDNISLFTVSGSYCHEVWRLCEALWAADLSNNGVPAMDDKSIVDRHNNLIEWLTAAVSKTTDRELSTPRVAEDEDKNDLHSQTVWHLLLGGRVLEACKTAKANGDVNMALLIAQGAGDEIFRNLLSRQLRIWSDNGAERLISRHKLYALRLLAGESCPGDGLADLDWLRAFNATARYIASQVPTLDRIVQKYESFFHDPNSMEEQIDLSCIDMETVESGMEYPVPQYCYQCQGIDKSRRPKKRILDLRYELIRARATNSRPQLHPESYTADPLDYSLSFLLGTWFSNPTEQSIIGMADQLEAHGFWHLAIQAMMFHPNTNIRNHSIRKLLSRNVPSKVNTASATQQMKLLEVLRIPNKWILLAQAHKAKYEKSPAVQVEHLVGACQWNAAHQVLINELMPRAVLSNDFDGLVSILEKMNEAAKRNEVSDWEKGGQAYYHYLHLRDEVTDIISTDNDGMSAAVESLWPRLFAACSTLGVLVNKTPEQKAATAHISSTLLQLAAAANATPGQLAALLKALKLPPDCRVNAQQKISTDIATRASEAYAESVNSSPLSSLHRNLGSAKN